MRPYDIDPTTDAELFQMLHGLFGIGDWDEDDTRPWFKVRAIEISKLKAMRIKRGLTYADFVLLARYCARHRIVIHKPWDLLEHRPQALRERSALARPQIDLDIDQAVAQEREQGGDPEWVDRLLRASGPGRQIVLHMWKTERGVYG